MHPWRFEMNAGLFFLLFIVLPCAASYTWGWVNGRASATHRSLPGRAL